MNTMTLKIYSLSLLAATCVTGPLSAQTLADYQTEVTSQSPSNYFKLDGSLESAVNPSVVLTPFPAERADAFTYDAFGNPSNSYFYVASGDELSNETDPLINTSGTTNGPGTATGSITFLFRSLSGLNAGGERWLFDGRGLLSGAGTGSHNALGLWFERIDDTNRTDPGCLKLEFGDTTTVILQTNDIVFGSWYYFALTYDEARVPNKAIWYLGLAGQELKSGMTTNEADAVAGDGLGLFVGNRSTLSGAFRSPGNGRIDEFAIWAKELSATEISNQFANLPATSSGGVLVTNVIVDDSFTDGDRANTGPLQADWWSSSSSSGNSIEAYTNQLGMVTGPSGRGIHGTFAPQNLEIGDMIRATYTFTTPATVGVGSTGWKVALMDLNDPGLAADLTASSTSPQPLYTNLPGYMADLDVNTGASADIGIRKHTVPNATGRFLGTTSEWFGFGTSGDAGYTFAPNTEYAGVFSIKRTDYDSVDIFCSMSQGGVLMDSHTESDSSGIANHFGMLGFWVNSNTYGSTSTAGELEDNGITFSDIRVEVVTLSTEAPSLSIMVSGGKAILSWPSTFTGYALESTTTLQSPTWGDAGAPTPVGDRLYVTNDLSGNADYYRLSKP